MKFYEAIKILRKQKGLSQKEVCKNIVDTSGYSRFENGLAEYSAEIIRKFLLNMNATFSDLEHIMVTQITTTNEYKQLDSALSGQHNESIIKDLYYYFSTSKNSSPKAYSAYILCKKHFHNLYPNIVPMLLSDEINSAYEVMINQTYHTYNDYLNFSDISANLTIHQRKTALHSLLNIPLDFVLSCKREIQLIYPRVIYNLADILIDDGELDLAKFALEQLLTMLKEINHMLISCLSIYSLTKIQLLKTPDQANNLNKNVLEMKKLLELYANDETYSSAIYIDFQNKINGISDTLTVFD